MAHHLYVTASVRTEGSKSNELGQFFRDALMQTPWLQTVYWFMGLSDMTFVHADGLDFGGPDYREQSLSAAKAQLNEIAQTW